MTLRSGKGKTGAKQVFLVLGMHRSGTSAVARGLLALGVDLGDRLMPAGFDNERGFWEDVEIVALNDAVLAALGANYHSLALLPPEGFTDGRLAGLEKSAVTLLRRKLRGVPSFGMKDPRLARLLPFWKPVFATLGVKPRYVIVLRNPRSVADSLERRNGFVREKSYCLWLEHLVPALCETEGSVRIAVDYDRLMRRPEAELRRLGKALDAKAHDDAVTEYRDKFLARDLQHTRYTPKDLETDPAAPSAVINAYRLLRRAARDKTDIDGRKVARFFGRLDKTLGEMGSLLTYLQRLDRIVRPTDQPG